MKQSDRQTRQPSAAKIKSEETPKTSANSRGDCSSPGRDATAATASNRKSKKRGVTVAPTRGRQGDTTRQA